MTVSCVSVKHVVSMRGRGEEAEKLRRGVDEKGRDFFEVTARGVCLDIHGGVCMVDVDTKALDALAEL